MIYSAIILLLTNRCNLECPHCCEECSPKNSGVLDDQLIEQVIHELASNQQIELIGISGGEAMLYPEKVKRTVQLINQAGKKSSIYTNGFWCSSYLHTYNTLCELKKNGLTLLLTSVDTYHQEKIPIENIKNLLSACSALDILVKIHTSTTYSNAVENDLLITSLELSKLNASITSSTVMSVGRATSNIEKNDIISTKPLSCLKCTYDGMCSVDWEGNVLWCCTLHNKNMIMGNVEHESINSILNKFRKNKVFMCILVKGLPYLASVIEKHKLLPLQKVYTNGCEFCNFIFENDELLEQLNEIL